MQVRVQVVNKEIYLIKHRLWRKEGEKPRLWSHQVCYVAEPRFVGDVKPHLHQLLSLGRFQKLKTLRLDCPELIVAKESSSLGRCLQLLQTVVAQCPELRKLTLSLEVIGDDWRGRVPKELVQVGAILTKFEEVDLTFCQVDHKEELAGEKNSKAMLGAVLKAVPGSRLKKLNLLLEKDQDKVAVHLKIGGQLLNALGGLRRAGVQVNIKARDSKNVLQEASQTISDESQAVN